jgi:hypothetical protein
MPSMREEDEHDDAGVPAIQVQAAPADDAMADVDTSVCELYLFHNPGQETD